VGERSTGAKSTVILDWALETCVENFPCHHCMLVSNLYEKTSGRTWRIGGSQIWVTNLSEDRKRFYLVSSPLDTQNALVL
jgi:hypothetical protein